MALDKRLQNPKRSSQDPTELNARLAAIEARLDALEEPGTHRTDLTDRRDWTGGDG